MSIHFISGKPGGGKTLYGVRLIVDELLHGSRVILTNVPLHLGRLNEYIQGQTEQAVDVVGRVWLLSDEQTGEFWTYRPAGVRIPHLTREQWSRGELPSYAGVKDCGVMYVIDEVHNYFGARQWAETGRDVLFYLSQHRKLGDTVVCITQAVGNVDKQFRSVTQDFTYIRNLSKEKYGVFRLPGIFIRKTFGSPPTETSEPMETGTFKLDVSGLASCYDSAQGVGIHGRVADRCERKKGFHYGWGLAGTAAVILIIAYGAPNAIASLFRTPSATIMAQPGVSAAREAAPGDVSVPAVSASRGQVPASAAVSSQSTNFVKGFARVSKSRILFFVSDGRTIPFPSAQVTEATPNYIVVSGERLLMRQ